MYRRDEDGCRGILPSFSPGFCFVAKLLVTPPPHGACPTTASSVGCCDFERAGMVVTAASPQRSARSQQQEEAEAPAGPPAKKLTPEEIEKLGARLCTPKKATKELPPLVKKVVLSTSSETKSVERLYSQSMATRNHNHELLMNKVISRAVKPETKKMDNQEMAGMVDRLHERGMSERLATMNKLMKQFVTPDNHAKLSTEQQQGVSNRLYDESRAKTTDKKTKLFMKYVVEREPKVPPQTQSALNETIARLSKKAE